MADKASADRVAADMQPANYRAAIKLIRFDIQKKKEKIAEINGTIGEQWGKIEGHKVNKKAGRIFMMLDKLAHDERKEIMFSLNGLIDAAGWDQDASDLVDAANGNVVPLRVGAGATAPADGDEDGDDGDGGSDDEMKEVEEAIAAPAKSRRGAKKADAAAVEAETEVQKRMRLAKEGVAKHFGQASVSPTPEGYTGDNSDLAGE